MGPFDVERVFQRPALVGGRPFAVDRLFDLGEFWRSRQAELLVEGGQVAGDVRIVVRVDDGDRLSRAVADDVAELDVVEAVGGRDLGGRVADRRA